jgi:hypothetical protein
MYVAMQTIHPRVLHLSGFKEANDSVLESYHDVILVAVYGNAPAPVGRRHAILDHGRRRLGKVRNPQLNKQVSLNVHLAALFEVELTVSF